MKYKAHRIAKPLPVKQTEKKQGLFCSTSFFEVEFFILNGADLTIRNNDGQSPLMKAAAAGSKRAVQTCLDTVFDVNETDLHGNTPLGLAAANSNDPEIIQLLVDAGAKADVTDNGKDIFALIEENKHRQERQKSDKESSKPDWDKR